jgi:hypothetical protein
MTDRGSNEGRRRRGLRREDEHSYTQQKVEDIKRGERRLRNRIVGDGLLNYSLSRRFSEQSITCPAN